MKRKKFYKPPSLIKTYKRISNVKYKIGVYETKLRAMERFYNLPSVHDSYFVGKTITEIRKGFKFKTNKVYKNAKAVHRYEKYLETKDPSFKRKKFLENYENVLYKVGFDSNDVDLIMKNLKSLNIVSLSFGINSGYIKSIEYLYELENSDLEVTPVASDIIKKINEVKKMGNDFLKNKKVYNTNLAIEKSIRKSQKINERILTVIRNKKRSKR